MNSIIYILLSCIEGFSFFFITFGLFRISMKDYLKEIVIVVFIISLGTLYLSEYPPIENYIPLINILILIIFLVFFFRVSLVNSLFITLIGYISCMVIQFIVLKAVGAIGSWDIQQIKDNIELKRIMQLASSLLIVLVSMVLRKYNLWFTFIPYSTDLSFKLSKGNIFILILGIITLLSFYYSLNISSSVFAIIIWTFSLLVFLYVGLRKEFKY